ncbi:hypothetical protein [Longispora albida]|uniref:hypothetical protein n=1 Tax=Longispora albida TaxID=203523 RepID=UPI0003822D4F|nr:hypothetical protein [Longispora albida]
MDRLTSDEERRQTRGALVDPPALAVRSRHVINLLESLLDVLYDTRLSSDTRQQAFSRAIRMLNAFVTEKPRR